MKRYTVYILSLLLSSALAGCSEEQMQGNPAGPTTMESVSVLTNMAEVSRAAEDFNADDPTMSPAVARAAHTMNVTLGSGSAHMQAIYIYQGAGKWTPSAQAVTFPDNQRQPIKITLKKSGTIIQDGSAQALIDADQLAWERFNQVPVRELANIPMKHLKTLVEFELGTINATTVSLDDGVTAYHVQNGNKWQAVIEPQTEKFIVSVTVNGAVSTAEVTEDASPTDGCFKADYRYTVPLVLNGKELTVGTVGVGRWDEGIGGTAMAIPPTRFIIDGLENQAVEVHLANAQIFNLSLDAAGEASQPAGVPMSVVTKIVCNSTEYLIGRPESGDIKLKVSGNAVVLRAANNEGSIPLNSLAELKLVASNTSDNYIQESDIDLMDQEWTPIWEMKGIYDGDSHSISGLKISLGNGNAGLFAANSGTIKNVVIASATSLKGEWHAGLICGENKGGTIEGCVNKASLTDGGINSLGGICGHNNKGTITNCKNTGTLTINATVPSDGTGGIAGYCSQGTISNCVNTGIITGKPKNTGGIAGSVSGTQILDCHNTGNLALPWGAGDNNGGIVGKSDGAMLISRCYNTGTVTVEGSQAGGICGQLNSGATISSCYNTGRVGAKWNSGGIAGQSTDATIIACHNDGLVKSLTTGWTGAGGICGFHKGTITACYNIGVIEGDSAIGAIVGEHNQGTISYCFWAGDVVGIPNGGTGTTGNAKFGNGNWPAPSMHEGWKTTADSPTAYWRTLGAFGGSYPKLSWKK